MRKTYQMFLALVAMMLLGAMNVSAEEISLKDVPFWQHEAGLWGLDAPKNTQIEVGSEQCPFVIGESTGQPYGDGGVNNWADLSGFDQLVITYTEGTPRVLMNRDQDNGQYSDNEAESHLIEYPKSAPWVSKYFTDQGGVLTVDLKQIFNDKGFVHLHAIKGANWANVTIESMILVRKGKEKQVGWVDILTNGNFEGNDFSSFVVALRADEGDGNVTYNINDDEAAKVEEGVGKGNSKGLSIKAMANAPQTWSTQLFVYLPEILPAGTEWRFSMDVISNPDASFDVGGHGKPREWKCGGGDISADFSGSFNSTSEWNTITAKGTISENLFGKSFQSIAFNLNNDKSTATQYYFDNIKFEIYKYGTVAEYKDDALLIDFGFETNLAELCKAAGKKRVQFPKENAKVLVNGEEISITSVEGFEDGRFFIFLDEVPEGEVRVIYNNVAGDMQLKYAGGPSAGQAVPNVDEIAEYNDDLLNGMPDDVYPYTMLAPAVVAAKPEQGSFNIKSNLKDFYVKFDKKADASKIVATLDKKALTVSPAEGMVEEVTLKYDGADLADGLHTINITKIYPEEMLDESIYTDTTYVFSVGAPDPTDVAIDLIPAKYFAECPDGGIPEGFKVYADAMEERTPGNTYTSNARMFAGNGGFAEGGDFTSALYFRRNYVTYGLNDDEHALNLEAGKTYTLTFNAARWKASGEFMKIQFLTADGAEEFAQVITCSPDVNGQKTPVKNSTVGNIEFTPATTGKYELRFVVCTNADGAEAGDEGMREMMIANVKFGYIPKAFGVVETIAVNEALEKAKKTQANNNGERYDGAAQTALDNAITKVEAEKDSYTSPSECNGAVELLTKSSADLIDHVALCNNYDNAIKTGSATVDQNKETKFKDLPLYAELVAVVAKYNGRSWQENVAEEGAEPQWERKYEFDVLKDDAALTAAIAELTEIVNTTAKLFTTGASQRNTTGVAALVERLRLGAETLKTLGRAEDSYPVAQALNALDDNDELAEEVKNYIKADVYGKLKDGENIFQKIDNSDPENPETVAATIDMSVFVKNPNMYSLEYSTEVPGWTTVSGNPAAWSSWDGNVSHGTKTPYVEDCCIYLQWHQQARVEQTITDLPAGIYTVQFNANDNSAESEGTVVYVQTSETPAVEEGAEFDVNVNAAGWAQVDNSGWDREVTDIVVTDGVLTLGFKSGSTSQPFLEYVKVLMKAPANVDYSALYTEAAAAGIETLEGTPAAKVRAIELFDLNGRRVMKAQKGLNIVKKVMSDGSVKTEKVIVK